MPLRFPWFYAQSPLAPIDRRATKRSRTRRRYPQRCPYLLLFVLRRSALFRIFRVTRVFPLGRGRTHNAGVAGSSPAPAIDEPITYRRLARAVSPGDLASAVQLRDALLGRARREMAISLWAKQRNFRRVAERNFPVTK
jgi:hypothetical protein